MRLVTLVLAVGCLSLAGSLQPMPAVAADDARSVVTQFVDQSLRVIGDPQAAPTDRAHRFQALIDRYFDIPVIARFALGPYWQTSSEAERRQFTKTFEDHLVRSYVNRFNDYRGETFRITADRIQDGRIIVSGEIVRASAGAPVPMDWIVQETPSGLRIRDVAISGISLALTYRNEFSSVVQRNNGQVAALIDALQALSSER